MYGMLHRRQASNFTVKGVSIIIRTLFRTAVKEVRQTIEATTGARAGAARACHSLLWISARRRHLLSCTMLRVVDNVRDL